MGQNCNFAHSDGEIKLNIKRKKSFDDQLKIINTKCPLMKELIEIERHHENFNDSQVKEIN